MVGETTILGTNIIHGANAQTTDFVQCRITAHNQRRSNLFRYCRMSEEYNYTTAYYDYLTYLLHTGEIHSFLFLIINGIPFPSSIPAILVIYLPTIPSHLISYSLCPLIDQTRRPPPLAQKHQTTFAACHGQN